MKNEGEVTYAARKAVDEIELPPFADKGKLINSVVNVLYNDFQMKFDEYDRRTFYKRIKKILPEAKKIAKDFLKG